MATAPQIDVVNEFQNLFKLLFKGQNWLLVLPPLVGAVVSTILMGIVFVLAIFPIMGGAMMSASSDSNAGAAAGAGLGLLSFVIIGVGTALAVIAAIFGYAWAIEAAEPMWSGGGPDTGGGFGRAIGKFGHIFIGGAIVGLVGLLLCITIIGPIVWGFFCLFVLPLIVLGGQSGTGAIGGSIKMVRDNLGPSLMLMVGLIVVSIAGFIVAGVLGLIPLLGWLIGLAIQAVLGAFFVLAIVRWYKLLTGGATAMAVTTTQAS